MPKPYVPVLVAAAAALAIAGCGESSPSGLTRAQLIARADPICQRANTDIKGLNVSTGNVAQRAEEIATVQRQTSTELQALKPPSSLSSDWRLIASSYQTVSNDIVTLAHFYRAKDTSSIGPAAKEMSTAQHDRTVTAFNDGFKHCSQY